MKSFRQYISEAVMYHGSPHEIDRFKPNRSEYMIDRAIGTHFSADPHIARGFMKGAVHMGRKEVEGGNLYRAQVPPASKILKVRQKVHAGGLEGDQVAIGAHIASTVFTRHKDMFKSWLKYRANGHVSDDMAEKIHDHLINGKPMHRKEFGEYGGYKTSKVTMNNFMKNYDPTLTMEPEKGFKEKVVNKYLDIMRKRGIKGLSYTNTSPMETRGLPQDTHPTFSNYRQKGQRGSRKCYVIFDPHHYPIQRVSQT